MNFHYEAMDQRGNIHKGKLESTSQQEAIQAVNNKGLHVLKVKPTKASFWKKDFNLWLGKPVKQKEFVFFCRQLAALLQAGTTLAEALHLLMRQAASKPFRQALEQVYQSVSGGNSFSDACSKHPKIFEKVFVNMIRAGEMAGNIDEIMDRVAIHYERDSHLKEKIKSAMMYPAVVGMISIVVVVFLLTQVIPQFVNTLVTSGAEIPVPTVIVLTASNILVMYWYLFILAAIVLFVTYILVRSQPSFRYYLDLFKLKVPVFGILNQKTAIARMSRTLSSLFSSAVPVLQSLTMVSEIVNNEVLARVLLESRESLRKGESLSGPLERNELFPPLVTHMIRVGEETGRLEQMLDKVAQFYEEDVDQMTSRLSAVLEPIMIVVLAVIVGTIVLAALLPMFQIYQNV